MSIEDYDFVKQEKLHIEKRSNEVKVLTDSLNDKIISFTHRIIKSISDAELFKEAVSKELKKIT